MFVFLCCLPTLQFSSPSIQISKTSTERGTVSAQQLGIHRRSKGECCSLLGKGAWLVDVDVYCGSLYLADQSLVRHLFLPQYPQIEPRMAKTVAVIRCHRYSAV